MNMNRRMMTERETIKTILKLAREQGCEDKVQRLIDKFQNAIKGAKTAQERAQIANLGIAEIHRTIGCVGGLVVNGVELIPPEVSYQEAIDWRKGLVNLG